MSKTYRDLLNNANNLYKKGDKEGAIAKYRSAIGLNSHRPDAYYKLALIFSMNGDVKDAIENFEKAAGLDPEDPSIYNNLGVVYYNTGNLEKAEFNFQKALALNAFYFEAVYGLAKIYQNKGKYKDAIIALKKSLTIDSKHQQALVTLKEQLLDRMAFKSKGKNTENRYTFVHVSSEKDGIKFLEMTPDVIMAFDIISRNNKDINLLVRSRRKLQDYPWEIVDIVYENNQIEFKEVSGELKGIGKGDIFVYPTVMKTYDVHLTQAVSSGIPVIGADVPFVKNIVRHGFNGLLVQTGKLQQSGEQKYFVDINDLVIKMYFLAQDPELVKEMSKNTQKVYHR